MGVPISNVTRRVVYTASGTGPYAFTFEILANTDIAVYKDDALLTLTTDYTVTIASNGTGSITLVAAPTGADQIAIVGNRAIKRTTDFVTGGDFFANTVNDEMDQQTIFAQQNAEGLLRALSAPQTDPTSVNMTLPRASVRANKNLAFDANGDPVVGEAIGDFRGNWTSGTAYNKRDLIKDTSNANIYYCVTAHTASGSQPISTNTDSAKWTLIVDAASAAAAQTAAEAAQAAAETAETNAETAETNAETAETNAETAATNAASSASAASTSATNAASSASSASTSASTATTKASEASTSATNAASSASSASTSASTATTKASEASTSASNASTSATNAATSATNASTSASTATTQATNAASSASAASTSATNASNSASAAATSETNAAASAAAAASSLDNFDDRYLGSKDTAPTLDNDGNALVAGALYFNDGTIVADDKGMYVYDGGTWIAASAASQAILVKYKYTATAGQTTFSGADDNALTLSYTAGSIIVTLNGVVMDAADYTATTGNSVVLGTAAALNDELGVFAFSTFDIANTYTQSQVDAFAVKLTGDQNIAGAKKFTGSVIVGRVNSGSEGGQIDLCRASDDASAWAIDVYGSTSTPSLRVVDNTASATRLEIDGNGTITLNKGQLKFPATQNASADANTLDDYEEGSWSPTINRVATSPTVSYSYQIGAYVKIGKIVTVFWDVNASSISGGSGSATLTGLPFPKAGQADAGGYSVPQYRSTAAIAAGPTTTTTLVGYLDSTAIYLEYDNIGTAGFGTNVTVVLWNGSGRISGWTSYITSS